MVYIGFVFARRMRYLGNGMGEEMGVKEKRERRGVGEEEVREGREVARELLVV